MHPLIIYHTFDVEINHIKICTLSKEKSHTLKQARSAIADRLSLCFKSTHRRGETQERKLTLTANEIGETPTI